MESIVRLATQLCAAMAMVATLPALAAGASLSIGTYYDVVISGRDDADKSGVQNWAYGLVEGYANALFVAEGTALIHQQPSLGLRCMTQDVDLSPKRIEELMRAKILVLKNTDPKWRTYDFESELQQLINVEAKCPKG